MGNPAILKAALEKAKANGWVYKHELDRLQIEHLLTFNSSYLSIIFSHDFAKALWGDAYRTWDSMYEWQYHLRELALAENRLEYLGANI